MTKMQLPSNYLVHYLLLFACCASQIDACCFDALMPHEVGKEGDVVEAVKEVLGEAVTERVWINHITVKTVLFGKVLQLDGYATSGKAVA